MFVVVGTPKGDDVSIEIDAGVNGVFGSRRVRLIFLVTHLFACLLLYGVLQERLLSRKDGLVSFPSVALLVALNRVFAVIMAAVQLLRLKEPFLSKAPMTHFALISLLNVGSTFCQYEALRWVSFPTQALGKSAKIVAAMSLGIVVLHKYYTFAEWAQASIVVIGCTIFSLTSTGKELVLDDPYGYVLLLGYLFCDSGTSIVQKRLFDREKELKWRMMLWVNSISCLMSVSMMVWDNVTNNSAVSLAELVSWFNQSPWGLYEVLALSACTSFAQLSIYCIIQEFGPVILAYAMTTRQIVSVVLSFVIFLHPISLAQALSACIVFGVILWKNRNGGGD